MAHLVVLVGLTCGMLSIVSSQDIGCTASSPSGINCSAWLDLNPQDNTTSNTTLNVCKLRAETQLLNLTEICYSEVCQCASWNILYLLIQTSGPQAVVGFNLNFNGACSGAVNITTPPPYSPNASYALEWTNSSVPEGCDATAEELLLSSVFFSMDLTIGYSSADVCLTFFDPLTNNASQPSCVHLLPPPTISYTPKPLPAFFKSAPVAVVNGGLTVNDLTNITYAKVTIDQSTFRQGDTLMVSSLPTTNRISVWPSNGATLTITGEASPNEYTTLFKNVLFNSSVQYPASRLVVMTVCDDTCCSDALNIIVELVFFTIQFHEDMVMRQVILGNYYDGLAAFASDSNATVSLNITLQSRNSVLDNEEYLYYGGLYSIMYVDTPTTSSLLILCYSSCTRALTSYTIYANYASEPSYYNGAGDLIIRDILVQLLGAGGSVLATAMLEVDIVPVNNHAPVLLLWLPCNSTNVATYRQKRHSPSKEGSYGVQRGHTWHNSRHAPNISSATLGPMSGHAPCLWSIIIVFSADTNAPPMESLGTVLHLLPSQLNDAMVGVVWEDEHTLVVKVTWCWLQNDTTPIDLIFKPQGESCDDHTPCTRGVCFANRTGCPVRGVHRVQLATSHQTTLPHSPSGMLILCLQFMTVGVVITSLLVMWQMAKRRRSVVFKVGEDGVPCVPKTPPQVAINITSPPSQQSSKKKPLVRNQSPMRQESPRNVGPPVNLTSLGQRSAGHGGILAPTSVGPPVVRNLQGDGGKDGSMMGDMCLPEQLEEREESKVEREVEPHSLHMSTNASARREGASVIQQERPVPTVGALQREGGSIELRPSPTHLFTSPSRGHHQMLPPSPQKHYPIAAANSYCNSSLS